MTNPANLADANARDACADLLLTTFPALMRGVVEDVRQNRAGGETHHLEHLHLLRALSHHPRTLREIAAHHHVTASTMSRSIETMVHKGWVARQDNPRDRREVILRLTDAGGATMDEMVVELRDRVAARLATLDESELARLHDGLRVLHQLLAKDDAERARGPHDCAAAHRGAPMKRPQTVTT